MVNIYETAGLLPVHVCYNKWNYLLQEAKVFKELVLADTSKALVHVFFAQRATSKVLEVMLLLPPNLLLFFQMSYQYCLLLASMLITLIPF